jgi:hypothetical protein
MLLLRLSRPAETLKRKGKQLIREMEANGVALKTYKVDYYLNKRFYENLDASFFNGQFAGLKMQIKSMKGFGRQHGRVSNSGAESISPSVCRKHADNTRRTRID